MNGFIECDFLCQAGRYEEAIKVYDEFLKINPQNANMWNKKGTALYELKRFEEAIKAYDKALEIDPHFAEAWINKGYVFIKLKRYEEEKGESYYEGYEAIWKDEFGCMFLNSNIPKGYYKCDIYEPVEECDHDIHEPIDSLKLGDYDLIKYFHKLNSEINIQDEVEGFDDIGYSETVESMQGDYDGIQYYCRDEVEPWGKNRTVCYNEGRFVSQAEYEAILDSYPSEDDMQWDYATHQDKLLEYASKAQIEKHEKPWKYYPEVLEALWEKEISNGYYNGLSETEVKTILKEYNENDKRYKDLDYQIVNWKVCNQRK